MPKKISSKPERIALRIIKKGFEPADLRSQEALNKRRYRLGEIVFAEIKRPRNPGYWRLAHQLGMLLAENVEEFTNLDAHSILKRLQIEGNIACEDIPLIFPGMGPVAYRVPKSLSFDSMDQKTFEDTYRQMCDYVAQRYWPELEKEEIAALAKVMDDR